MRYVQKQTLKCITQKLQLKKIGKLSIYPTRKMIQRCTIILLAHKFIDQFFNFQAAQVAVRLEGDVITAHGSVSSLPIGSMAAVAMTSGKDSMSPDDNTSVCSCSCDRWASSSGYRTGSPYLPNSVIGVGDTDVQHIPLETFYDACSPPDVLGSHNYQEDQDRHLMHPYRSSI